MSKSAVAQGGVCQNPAAMQKFLQICYSHAGTLSARPSIVLSRALRKTFGSRSGAQGHLH